MENHTRRVLQFTLCVPPQSLTSPRRACLFFQGANQIVTTRATSGTNINLGGDFALSLGGSRSQYLPSDASARDVKLALEAMDTVGTVDVERNDGDAQVRQSRTEVRPAWGCTCNTNRQQGPTSGSDLTYPFDVRHRSQAVMLKISAKSKARVMPSNVYHIFASFSCQVYGGYTWIVTFGTDLGDVDSLTGDIMSMTGTAPVLAVSENVKGVTPSFSSLDPGNSLPLGSATLTDLSDLYMNVAGLEEGVPYYFRVTASNYIGSGMDCAYPTLTAWLPWLLLSVDMVRRS